MKKARILALVITLAVTTSMFTACGKTDKKTTEPKAGTPTASEPEKPKPTLKWLGRNATFDLTTDPMKKELEAITGYKVEYEALPEGDTGTQKLLIIAASGTEYDIIKPNNQNDYDKALSNKIFMPMDELIEKYGPNAKKNLGKDAWSKVTVDGKIYGIPYTDVTNGGGNSTLVVRKDIFDELGLKIPTTADELYTVLTTLKAKKPDMLPLALDNDGTYFNGAVIENVMSAFGMGQIYAESNGTLLPLPKQAGFKDYLTYMNKLYKENLIDKEMPAVKRATKNEKFASGKAVMMKVDWWEYRDVVPALIKNVPNAKLEFVPMLKNKDGKATVTQITTVQGGVGIAKTSKNSVDAMKYIDLLMQPDNFKKAMIGAEGTHYEIKNNEYFPKDPLFVDKKNAFWYVPTYIDGYYPMWLARLRANQDHYFVFTTLKDSNKAISKPEVINYAPYMENNAKYRATSEKFMRDEMIKFIAGASPLTEVDKFVEKYMKEQGGEAMEKEYTAWYKTFKK